MRVRLWLTIYTLFATNGNCLCLWLEVYAVMHFAGWVTFPEEQQVCSSKERLAVAEGFIVLCCSCVFGVSACMMPGCTRHTVDQFYELFLLKYLTSQFIARQVPAALASSGHLDAQRFRRTTWQYIQWPRYKVVLNLALRTRYLASQTYEWMQVYVIIDK